MLVAFAFVVSLVISVGTGALLGVTAGVFIAEHGSGHSSRLLFQILGGLLGAVVGYDIFMRVILAIYHKTDDPNPTVRHTSIPAFALVVGGAWCLRRGWFVALPIGAAAATGFVYAREIEPSVGVAAIGAVCGAILGWLGVLLVGAALGWLIGVIFLAIPPPQGRRR